MRRGTVISGALVGAGILVTGILVTGILVTGILVTGILVTGGRGAVPDPVGRRSADHPRPAAAATRARVRVVWSQPVRGWPSQMTVAGRDVVAVSGGRFVSALTTGAGAVRWETEVSGWLHPFLEPAVDAHTVLVSAGDRFVALDRGDGAVRWEVAAAGDARGVALMTVEPARSAAGAIAVTATAGEDGSGAVTGRDVRDGRPRWTATGSGVLDAHLATDRATSLVVAIWRTPTAATVRAIDAATGAVRWDQPVEPMVASPVLAGDAVLVASGDGDHRAYVRALDVADGRARWTTPVPASFEPDLVPGVDLAAGEVAVHDHLGTVSLLDLGTGALRWQTETEVPALGGRAVLLPDAVVVRNEGQEVVFLERSRGRLRERRSDAGAVPEGIARSGHRVLVAWRRTEPGRIDALRVDDIEEPPTRPREGEGPSGTLLPDSAVRDRDLTRPWPSPAPYGAGIHGRPRQSRGRERGRRSNQWKGYHPWLSSR